ncbi:MAG TPA: heavy metal translocating P-type ATPase [Sphingobacteriaceae bacterium]
MGLTIDQGKIKQSFPIIGMTCASCAISVENELQRVPGVISASVNFATQMAIADFDAGQTSPEKLQTALQGIGFDLVINADAPLKLQEELQQKQYLEVKKRAIWTSVLAFPVAIIGMFFMHLPFGNWISMAITVPVLFWFGRQFFINAFKQALHRKANMDSLVALSTGIAFLFSAFNTMAPDFWHSRGLHAHVYFEAAAVVVAFISIGKWLEERAKSNTSNAIRKLIGLQPQVVTLLVDGRPEEVSIAEVKPGSLILIKPGDRIPVDGTITSGFTYIDESMITGEPAPAKKRVSERVFAGTINQKGTIQFEAEKVGSDTLLAHIIKKVQEAQGSKAPVQKLVDKIAGIFVPVVIGISLLTFFCWLLLGGEDAFTHALLTSITVLVIACPCALGLATPTAIMVGVGRGAENNILIKDAESLELGHKVDTVILDKTGTITEGRPEVADCYWHPDAAPASRNVLYSLELLSEHPLASAVVNHLASSAAVVPIHDFESVTGHGIRGSYGSQSYFVGNRKLIDHNRIKISERLAGQADLLHLQANTVVYFADSDEVLAVISISDQVKPGSLAAISKLKRMGIEVFMLTGDNELAANRIAREVGIARFHAEMLPSDKAEFIEDLQAKGRVVAMVGDGINDSHALAQADVSIAMGKGSEIAIDVAKITLITSDLQAIAKALILSRKTVQTIRQNLFWAFIYNVIGIPLAAGVLYSYNGFLLDPMVASAAMALSSFSVVTNSLTLRKIKL